MARCETVIIQTENGEVVMNKSEYDPKIHTLASEKVSKPKKVEKKRDK